MKKLAALLLTLCLALAPAALAEETAAPTTAPNEAGMPYLLDDHAAAPVTLSDWLGTPTFLNFFTTWCVYCKGEMQDLKELQARYGDSLRVVLVHIPDGEDEQTARDYLKKEGLDELAFVEDNGYFAYMYGIQGFPTSVVMDAEGYLSSYFPGAIQAAAMAEAVEKAGAVLPEESHAD